MQLDKSNSRKHSDRNKAAIRKSLETAKAARSIVIDSGDNVLAGNGVAEQWEAMGGKVRVVETSGDELVAVKRVDVAPDSPQARQIATLDNLVADTSAFDYDAERLREALANDPVSKAIAEQDERLRKLLKVAKPESVDAGELVDRAAQLQEKWRVSRGDLWQCGKHRILCGDSTNAEDVARLMGDDHAKMFATDPPYGVGYEYASHDDKDENAYFELCKGFMPHALALGCFGVVTVGHKHNNWWFRSFDPNSFLIWYDKTKQSPHKIAHLCKTELVLAFGKPTAKYAWDILEVQGVRGDGLRELHTCPKPSELFEKLIEPQTERGDIIVDFFLGSGTTLIAAEQTGRIGRGVEIEPKYVAVSLERLANLGLTCERISQS